MARYIDADLAQNTIKKLCDDYKISYGKKYGGFGGKISNIMENIPTADVQEIKHGKWKEVYKNGITTVYECTNCKHLTFGISDYCICGAQMDGKEDKQ